MRAYLLGDNSKKDLVRFYYADREDMFDAVSYAKGGRILHMLRNVLGDSAFFKGLNLYLTTNKFKPAEAHHLRLALEEVSGMDLSWFFNQWYFGNGHPKLDIQYKYNDTIKEAMVIVKQTQNTGKLFRLPTIIDVYEGSNKKRNSVIIENLVDTFRFTYTNKPDLINFDGDKILLCEKKENKSLENYIHQFYFAKNYMDRREAVEFCGRKMDDPKALALLKDALKDPFDKIRGLALSKIDTKKDRIKKEFESTLAEMVKPEKNRPVKATIITLLGNTENEEYKSLYVTNTTDSSYTVAGASLEALSKIDSVLALEQAIKLSKFPAKGELDNAINTILVASGKEEVFDKLAERFSELGLSNEKFNLMQQIAEMTGGMKSNDRIKKSIDLIVGLRDEIPANMKDQIAPYINNMILQSIATKLKSAGNEEMVKYLESKK
jgi:aminopeptidase N